MSEMLSYKGYGARVEFDARDRLFVGRVLGVEEGISFHGQTVAELIEGFHAAVNHYLADCAAASRAPQRPYSGRLMLRVPPEVHAHAAMRAAAQGKSLNQWAAEILAKAS